MTTWTRPARAIAARPVATRTTITAGAWTPRGATATVAPLGPGALISAEVGVAVCIGGLLGPSGQQQRFQIQFVVGRLTHSRDRVQYFPVKGSASMGICQSECKHLRRGTGIRRLACPYGFGILIP